MIKRIVVALDPDQDTPTATRYAAEIARRYDGVVSGLAVIDTGRIARETGPGWGGWTCGFSHAAYGLRFYDAHFAAKLHAAAVPVSLSAKVARFLIQNKATI